MWPGTQSFGPHLMGHTSAEFFLLSQCPVCLSGAVERRVSLARCADDPGSPAEPALALGGPTQGARHCGVCGCGQVREGYGPSGMGAASAPLDETACASFPFFAEKDVTTSTHAHPHT